ncbi:MAG: hypothetical protein JNM62_06260 [Flavobacteriales bacterium]|nr:hypothetical protein [Flavobacteriales bacterium]
MKKNVSQPVPGSKKVQQREERDALKQLLLKLPEERVGRGLSDEKLDRENAKIQLLDQTWTTPYEQRQRVDRFVAEMVQPWEKAYPQVYYTEIYRLNGWAIPEGMISEKPSIVAQWTNEIIYMRFPPEVFGALRERNPLLAYWLRGHKHHQWLTAEGRVQLLRFIQDAIDGMKECATWYEFQLKHAQKYKLPVQLRLLAKG